MTSPVHILTTIASAFRRHLEQVCSRIDSADGLGSDAVLRLAADPELQDTTAIEAVTVFFGLSSFERDLLLFCLAAEIDPGIDVLCARAQQNPKRAHPTFALAVTILGEPHWDAIAPTSPLRRWRLIELGIGDTLVTSPLRIDERILHFMLGSFSLDKRLSDLVSLAESSDTDSQPVADLAVRAAGALAASADDPPVIQLQGVDPKRMRAVASAAAAALGLPLYILPSLNVPAASDEQIAMAILWERETILGTGLLAIDCSDESDVGLAAAQSLVERMRSPVLTIGRERLQLHRRADIVVDVGRPSAEEQTSIWHRELGEMAGQAASAVTTIVEQFDLTSEQIRAACEDVTGAGSDDIAARLWSACRRQSRVHLEELAHRIEPRATWGDLVLPHQQKEMLKQIVAHVRRRSKVHDEWGFAAKSSRGLGTAALFSGTSGTGKTLSAEVIASELKLDLYHIDLSSIVSKYIGETEKNLRRIFDAADESGAVLLFDEADALFGKRSEVKDSHDRYANLEVSYLLQRIESYRGLAILTTNMKQALDNAFLRRIRFIVNFEYPDAVQRAEIWWRVIPPNTPTDGLNFTKLASLNIAGGSIWNIALQAAYLAADAEEPIRMYHMLQAAKIEYAKLEKPLSDADVHGWI